MDTKPAGAADKLPGSSATRVVVTWAANRTRNLAAFAQLSCLGNRYMEWYCVRRGSDCGTSL